MTADLGTRCQELFASTQAVICSALEAADGKGRFVSDRWKRQDPIAGEGGGGDTRVIRDGAVIEQGGVNFSAVHGVFPADVANRLVQIPEEVPFTATGVSLVIHPRSPLVPTVHANFRYLEAGDRRWFGGGADLTPYYLFDEDAVHFHGVLKRVCDRHGVASYERFKHWCDEYFFLPHRGECRGIGGIFFDYLGKDGAANLEEVFRFVQDAASAFVECYVPIVQRRKDLPFTEEQRRFQLLRRGRYVEFNLLYDRGTQFGLKTGGRTESILMSLPPEVRWEYCFTPAEGSEEARLLEILRHPRAWI